MQELVAVVMVVVGAGVAATAPIAAGISLIRMVDAQHATVGDRRSFRVVTAKYLSWMLGFAIVATVGLCLLVVGLVVGYGLPRWAPALPSCMLALEIVLAGYALWLLRRERVSR